MINFDDITKENIKRHNPDWLQILDDTYIISTTGGYGTGKTNSLFHLINHHPSIDQN